jgi:hypothetical protein
MVASTMMRASSSLMSLLIGCGCPCDPDAEARQLAGGDAIDCGFVPFGADPEAAIACGEAAVADGAAFHVGFELRGRDTEVRSYLAGDADGTIWALGYDGGLPGSCANLVASLCTDTPVRFTGSDGTMMLSCPSSSASQLVLCSR